MIENKVLDRYNELKSKQPKTLFVVTKSNNKNVLNYSWSILENNININPTWWMFEKKDVPLEKLTFMEENMAYGISYLERKDIEHSKFNLVGYPNIQVDLIKQGDNYIPIVEKNELVGIEIELTDGIIPTVKGVYLVLKKEDIIYSKYIKN